MYEPTVEQSTLQLILDQVEEVLVTIIDEIRQRPGVALALLAAVTGAFGGSTPAARASRRHAIPPKGVVGKDRGMGDASELAGLGLQMRHDVIMRREPRSAVCRQIKQ